jgi:hypothetical protein
VYKKVNLYVLLIALLVPLFFYFRGERDAVQISIHLFIVLWGLDKVILWHLGEKFGLHAQLRISADSHPALRMMGLVVALIVVYFGAQGLIERVAT